MSVTSLIWENKRFIVFGMFSSEVKCIQYIAFIFARFWSRFDLSNDFFLYDFETRGCSLPLYIVTFVISAGGTIEQFSVPLSARSGFI
jgi:hypothetical protein